MLEDLPLDWAEDVLPERVTEDEMDRDMTRTFWSWDGPEEEGDGVEPFPNEEEPR